MKKIYFVLFTMILIACDKPKEDDETASAGTPSFEVTTGKVMNAGVLALGSLNESSLGVKTTALYLDDESSEVATTRDKNCSKNGNPFNPAGTRMNAGDSGYASSAMYCAAVFNTGSPDSVLGAISVAGVFTCELERAGAWSSDDDFTEAGNNVGTKTITLSTNCTEQWLVERLSDGGNGIYELKDVTLTKLPATHGYDKKISVVVDSSGPGSTFYIRNSNGFVAARSDNWAFSIDTINGVLRYETLGESTSSDDSKYVRRMRLKLSGKFSSTGAYESLTDVQGLKLEGRGIAESWSELVTITGVPETGLLTNLYYKNGATNDVMVTEVDQCTGSDCSALTSISATEAAITKFHQDAKTDFTAHDAKEGIIVHETANLDPNAAYDVKR